MRWQQLDTSSSQLNGQGQAIQAHTDLGQRRRIACGHFKSWNVCLCALDEESDGGIVRHGLLPR